DAPRAAVELRAAAALLGHVWSPRAADAAADRLARDNFDRGRGRHSTGRREAPAIGRRTAERTTRDDVVRPAPRGRARRRARPAARRSPCMLARDGARQTGDAVARRVLGVAHRTAARAAARAEAAGARLPDRLRDRARLCWQCDARDAVPADGALPARY